jgi:hypothetical protein
LDFCASLSIARRYAGSSDARLRRSRFFIGDVFAERCDEPRLRLARRVLRSRRARRRRRLGRMVRSFSVCEHYNRNQNQAGCNEMLEHPRDLEPSVVRLKRVNERINRCRY